MPGEMTTVPVVLDGYPQNAHDGLVRCMYFTIVADEPQPDWTLQLRGGAPVPFFMLGLRGIIHRPIDVAHPTFDNWMLLEDLIRAVEAHEGLSVDTEYLWLPTALLDPAWHLKVVSREQPPRGSVFRLNQKLFGRAFSVAQQGHGFLALADMGFAEEDSPAVVYSREETAAIRRWSTVQIAEHARFRANEDRGFFI